MSGQQQAMAEAAKLIRLTEVATIARLRVMKNTKSCEMWWTKSLPVSSLDLLYLAT